MMNRPIENSYWVVPRRLLAGEYPGSQQPEDARAKVRTLLHAGVTAFVDLTEEGELEPYSDLVAPALHHRLPIRDISVPASTDQMARILDTIDRYVSESGLVYVHCWGGVGRTGIVIGCWLARRSGGREALRMLQELWKECPKSIHRQSPETREQERYILDWRAGA